MTNFPFILVAIVAALTISVAIQHGNMTDRWGVSQDAEKAGSLIEELPRDFGDWQLVIVDEEGNEVLDGESAEERSLSEEAERQLRCHGYVYRNYRNKKNKQKVTVAFLVGPPGPIAVHTPEICFSSREYRNLGSKKEANVDLGDADAAKFWALKFRSKSVAQQEIEVYYAWNGGNGWEASSSPRWDYCASGFLYKMQVVCPLNERVTGVKNPCEDFLKDFLPVANLYVSFNAGDEQ